MKSITILGESSPTVPIFRPWQEILNLPAVAMNSGLNTVAEIAEKEFSTQLGKVEKSLAVAFKELV